ncbi:MAG: hypothetical protein QOJ79_2363 [Actinomycetota bacterium]|jgi:hypothetical protein|nr:hypothetical protein [Actinomycetota bacterium]
MTEQPPPTDRPADDGGDDVLDDPWHDSLVEAGDAFGATEVVAVVAFVLALSSVFSWGLLDGNAYISPFIDALSDNANKTALVLGPVIGAVLALVPVWMGWLASARSLADDPRWVIVLARSAVILGLASGFLHLVVAVLMAAQDGEVRISSI